MEKCFVSRAKASIADKIWKNYQKDIRKTSSNESTVIKQDLELENHAIRIPAMGQMFLSFLRHKYGTPMSVKYLVKEGDFVKKGDPIGTAGVAVLSPVDGKVIVTGINGYTFWDNSGWMRGHEPANKVQERSCNLLIIQPVKGGDATYSNRFSYQNAIEEIENELLNSVTKKSSQFSNNHPQV